MGRHAHEPLTLSSHLQPAILLTLHLFAPAGPRDLYVFGLQELGTTANREAWSAALVKHLQPAPKEGSLTAAGIVGASAASSDAARAKADAPQSLASKLMKLPGEKVKTPAEVAAELAASMGTTASKMSAAETERAYVLLDYVNMWEMVSATLRPNSSLRLWMAELLCRDC